MHEKVSKPLTILDSLRAGRSATKATVRCNATGLVYLAKRARLGRSRHQRHYETPPTLWWSDAEGGWGDTVKCCGTAGLRKLTSRSASLQREPPAP